MNSDQMMQIQGGTTPAVLTSSAGCIGAATAIIGAGAAIYYGGRAVSDWTCQNPPVTTNLSDVQMEGGCLMPDVVVYSLHP